MELNPNHPTTSKMHDHWHKLAAILVNRIPGKKTTITLAECERLARDNMAITMKETAAGIELKIVSTVEVKRGDDILLAVFEGADKNKVTLRPLDEAGKHRPYLELAETVMLSDGSSPGVKAQVWDNRGSKIILRTLPV